MVGGEKGTKEFKHDENKKENDTRGKRKEKINVRRKKKSEGQVREGGNKIK